MAHQKDRAFGHTPERQVSMKNLGAGAVLGQNSLPLYPRGSAFLATLDLQPHL